MKKAIAIALAAAGAFLIYTKVRKEAYARCRTTG